MSGTGGDGASTPEPPRICVVGAGITGLAAAWEVRRSAPEAELVVLEAASRPGGAIRTSRFAGLAVDEGADAFLARSGDGAALCGELGLADDLVAPVTGRAFVHLDGELVPLPRAHFLGVPLDPDDLDARLLSPAGLRALRSDPAPSPGAGRGPAGSADDAADDAADVSGDCTIGALVRRRLGDETLERLVGPLVGAINAGDCDRLSLRAAAAALAEAARSPAGIIEALRARTPDRPAGGEEPEPVFWGLRGGMERLTSALAGRLRPALALEEPALALHLSGGGSVGGVETPRRRLRCDAVVLAVGAGAGAGLVAPWAPRAAALLEQTETASVALVALAYRRSEVPAVRSGSGFVVPAGSSLGITACSWASTKWAHLAGDGNKAILRVSVGRHGDDGITRGPDEALVAAARAGLEATMDVTATPLEARVSRYFDAFPQYAPGHLERTGQVEASLGSMGVFCAGASYRGIGIPACIAGGRRAGRLALGWARRRAQR